MKISKYTWVSFLLLVVIAAVYRAIPDRPWGFAPQFAMGIFAGALISNRILAFALPLVSLFLSDALYQVLHAYGYTEISGFYSGMIENYLLIGSLTFIGFFINPTKLSSITKGCLASPTLFFFASNALTWLGNGGLQRPKTFSGLVQALIDGVPFYTNSLIATVVFSAILFGSYQLIFKKEANTNIA
jgi:hypothetical protein